MIVGVDIGYGYTKVVGKDKEIVFPSIVGKAERIRYENDLELPMQNEHGIALLTEEGDRFIGELALLQSRVRWTLLDRSRVKDPSARLLFLAALSEVMGYVSNTLDFRVVTGLPVKWFADRQEVIKQWQGKHFVRRLNGSQLMQHFLVQDIVVVPQPFGSLFSCILGPQGRIVDEDLAGGRVGVLDIGTFTTDYVLADSLRYIEKGSGSISTAMSSAYQLIGRAILDSFGLDLRMHEIDRAVRRGTVTVFGEQRDIQWLAAPILDAISEEILAFAATLWGDGRDLDTILVTGGGAMALGERVCRRYGHARVLDDAPLANAKGFQLYGHRKWRAK